MLWVTTPSGRKWSLTQPRAEDVDIMDIAQNLSLQVRFNGSLGRYSVAEHSCHCHDEAVRLHLPREWRLLCLLHDAHEAYMGDFVTPAINALDVIVSENNRSFVISDRTVSEALRVMRIRHDIAIFAALGLDRQLLSGEAWFKLKSIDAAAMMTERDALGPAQPEPWGSYENISRLPFWPECWKPRRARIEFIKRLALYNAQADQLLDAMVSVPSRQAAE